ncbi:hypothetical protein PENSPDRAFT_659003 [Peniophora sp. CONT]|nr:hypothetical protein PENSPDRAFT_659003 [Peniophora sp. CONT]
MSAVAPALGPVRRAAHFNSPLPLPLAAFILQHTASPTLVPAQTHRTAIGSSTRPSRCFASADPRVAAQLQRV